MFNKYTKSSQNGAKQTQQRLKFGCPNGTKLNKEQQSHPNTNNTQSYTTKPCRTRMACRSRCRGLYAGWAWTRHWGWAAPTMWLSFRWRRHGGWRWRRWRWWLITVVVLVVYDRQNYNNQFLTMLAVLNVATDEEKGAWSVKFERWISTVHYVNGVLGVTCIIVFFCNHCHWIRSFLVLEICMIFRVYTTTKIKQKLWIKPHFLYQ